MNKENLRPVVDAILTELSRAEKQHPNWPIDPVHASAVLSEESGELTQAALKFCYESGDRKRMKEEAVQCGAMAIRFLMHLEQYKR